MSKQFYANCDFCNSSFEFSNGRYAGRKIVSWDMMICEGCDSMNWDGLVVSEGDPILGDLSAKNVDLSFNDKGFLVIPGKGQ